jgi:hypothetical protein
MAKLLERPTILQVQTTDKINCLNILHTIFTAIRNKHS